MNITFYDGNPQKGTVFQLPYTVITDSFLDEELDVCPIELKNTTVDTPFPRFSVAAFCTTEGATPSYWFVGSDEVHTNVATGLSDHTVQLIEPTKWLERFMVGNKAVTQPIYTDYSPDPNDDCAQSGNLAAKRTYQSMYTVGDPIPIFGPEVFGYTDLLSGERLAINCSLKLDGVTEYQTQTIYSKGDTLPDVTKNIIAKLGAVAIYYSVTLFCTGDIDIIREGTFYFSVVPVAGYVKQLTLEDAAMSMICAAEILKSNGRNPSPRFRLNEEIAKELALITSPEITVTNATLREALDEIGKVINSITRLDIIPDGDHFVYEITFERYCKDTAADLSELGSVCEIARKVSCEDYCTALDATVDNIVNYKEGGSVWDPCYDLWRTVRSEDASYRVTEDTAEIFTAFPIERIDGLFCRIYVGDSQVQYEERDLTPYLFEASEYAALSSYTPAYPYSKAYALCYTLGKRNITGLNFTVPNPVHTIFEKPALVNIVNKAFGELNEGEDPLPGWPFSSFKALDFTKPLFKVKYVPTGAARVIMRKPNSFGKPESVLAYNQSAAKLDASAFGRSMFGAVLRMGNEETTYTYITTPGAQVPEKGERFGEDGYIAEIREEYAPHQKKVTLTVVEGFNRLSQFVGVNKTQRLFEISERMSLDRHIVYEDKCLISTKRHKNLAGSIVKHPNNESEDGSFLEHIRLAFSKNGLNGKDGAPYVQSLFATTIGYDENQNPLKPCFHPCVPYAFGNALAFTVGFEDNYSAGRRIDTDKRSIYREGEHDEKQSENKYYATETDVRYTDLFGRVSELELWIDDGINQTHIGNFGENHYRIVANAIPEQTEIVSTLHSPIVLAQGANRLYIDKDTRETIKTLTYQVSFLGDDGIKISPYFTECLPFARNSNALFAIVPIMTPITNTTEWIHWGDRDPPRANSTAAGSEGYVRVVFTPSTGTTYYTGWAAVSWNDTKCGEDDAKYKRFLFGKNFTTSEKNDFNSNKTIEVYFNFYH